MLKIKLWLKRVIYGALLYIVIRQAVRIRQRLKQMRRTKRIILKLPHKPSPPEIGNSFDFYGPFKRGLPNGFKEYDELERCGFNFLLQCAEEFKDEGVFLLMFANPKALPFFPGFVCIKGFEETKEILSAKNLPFLIKGAGYDNMKDVFGEGVLNTSGEKWRHQRIVVDKAFTEKAMKSHFDSIVEAVEEFIEHLKPLNEIPVYDTVLKVTFEVLGRVGFSQRFDAFNNTGDVNDDFFSAFSNVLHVLIRRARLPYKKYTKFLPFAENIKYNKSLNMVNTFVQTVIDKRADSKAKSLGEAKKLDLLDYILGSAVDSKGNTVTLTRKEMFDSTKTLILAGHETTAGALTWFILLCAKNPKVMDKIREEFRTELNGEITHDSIEKANYLNCVVLEVLRLYPTTVYAREATKDLYIGKHLIPAGASITLLPHVLQRDPKYYKEPNKFIPERWLELVEGDLSLQAKIANFGKLKPFTAFSLGARNCAGRKLALLELRLIGLLLVLNFDLLPPEKQPDGYQEVPYLGFTFEPRNINIRLKHRNN